MPLEVRSARPAVERRPIVSKEIVDRRKGLREISNIPLLVTKQISDLKVSNGVNQNATGTKPLNSVPQSNLNPTHPREKRHLSKKENIEDIDKLHSGNLFLVSEYAKDVYSYLMKLEVKLNINKWPIPNTMITERMRSILIDWLVDVHVELNLLQETIHTAVAILDRYIQIDNNLEKDVLQLVGICALSLACKYEEIIPPSMDDFVFLCKNTYHRKEMLEMEKKMLQSLDYDLGRPVSVVFLRRFNMAAKADKLQHSFSKYFIDSVLLDCQFCHIRPSLVAAAAAFNAMCITSKSYQPSLWTHTMVHYSSYKFSDVQPVASQMAVSLIKGYKREYDSVRKKYAQSTFLGVSMKALASQDLLKIIARGSSIIDIPSHLAKDV